MRWPAVMAATSVASPAPADTIVANSWRGHSTRACRG